MAKLFDIVGTEVTIDPTVLAIPAIKAIWDRDKSKAKEKAINEIKYIVFLVDYKSPYRDLHESIRELAIIKDIFKKEDWKPDSVIKDAIDKYKVLRKTKMVMLLENAEHALDELSSWFGEVNFKDTDAFGRLKFDIKDVKANLKEIGGIAKSIAALKNQVETELSEMSARGSNEIGYYEIPR